MSQTLANHIDQEVQIAADDALDDNRSELESVGSVGSSSTSLASSIRDYHFENGRTYHRYKEGKYNLPNDERENDRLDLQHHICLMTLGGSLGLAPPCQPDFQVQRALDLGTGTGIWAIQFADDHPECEVLGVDLSPTQPDFVAPNVKFEVDDVEDEWTFAHPFDYIHSRFMTSSISNWKEYITKCYDNLTPGGYLELQEIEMSHQSDDGTFPSDCALARMFTLLKEAAITFGRAFVDPLQLKSIMVEVGFEDVVVAQYKWPTNGWPKDPKWKELGLWTLENYLIGLEALAMAPLTRGHNWTRQEVDVFLVEVRKDLKNRAFHSYSPIYFVYGRKPLKEDSPAPLPAAATPQAES